MVMCNTPLNRMAEDVMRMDFSQNDIDKFTIAKIETKYKEEGYGGLISDFSIRLFRSGVTKFAIVYFGSQQ